MSSDAPPVKRYRKEEPKKDSDDEWKVSDEEKEDFKPYVPVRERRKQKLVSKVKKEVFLCQAKGASTLDEFSLT